MPEQSKTEENVEPLANIADEEQVKKRKSKVQRKREKLMADYRAVLAIPEGRRVLWDLLGFCKIYQDIVGPNAEVHRYIGRRKVGLKLIANINEAEERMFLTMQEEALKRGEAGL